MNVTWLSSRKTDASVRKSAPFILYHRERIASEREREYRERERERVPREKSGERLSAVTSSKFEWKGGSCGRREKLSSGHVGEGMNHWSSGFLPIYLKSVGGYKMGHPDWSAFSITCKSPVAGRCSG